MACVSTATAPSSTYEPQPAYGWKLTANNRFSWWTDGESREIDVNSHGRRDRERSFDKPDGTCRIVVLGDSLMEGLQVAGQNTFSSVLETALRTDPSVAPAHVEVLNTGVSGYGTDNELLYFRNEGYRYAPDLVILGFTIGNDIRNNQPQLEIINTGGVKFASRSSGLLTALCSHSMTVARSSCARARRVSSCGSIVTSGATP